MKGKILVVGLIALLLAGGLILASCEEKCSSSGSCIAQTDSYGDVKRALDCNNSGCSVTSLTGTDPRPNMNVTCNCE
jgi:hypothetical protein